MNNLNLVLLGLRSSGKSALLGALQQAAQSKGTDVDGALVDLSGELTKLRQASLDEKYHPTRDAVAAYPMQRRVEGRDETVTLHDTSGAETATLLADKELATTGPVPHALAEADGVLLVVDASSSKDELKQQFDQFKAFLANWQMKRSQAASVGGLPVFLVLAKCDKIAVNGETFGQWTQRIEEAKRRVGDQLSKALEDSRELSFGRVDVRVWATAVKRPVADKPSRANDPYQVAELFQQVFAAAGAFRRRSDRSSQTLQGALVGLGGLAVLLSLIMTWYFATQPTLDEAALESQVRTLLAGGEDSPSEQVREPIEDRLKELRDVKDNAAYGQLPADVREQLAATENAILAYQRLNADYQKEVRNPRLALRESDLLQIEKTLKDFDGKVKPWPETRLAKRHQEWSAETAALLLAVKDEEAWTRAQISEWEKLRAAGGLVIAKQVDAAGREAWFKSVHDFAVRDRRHKNTDKVAGTTIPYRIVYQVDRVEAAEREWRQAKDRLEKLREEALEK